MKNIPFRKVGGVKILLSLCTIVLFAAGCKSSQQVIVPGPVVQSSSQTQATTSAPSLSTSTPPELTELFLKVDISGSTNSLPYTINIMQDGSGSVLVQTKSAQNFKAGTVNVASLKSILDRMGDISQIAGLGMCLKSASFGTATKLTYKGKVSGDISCSFSGDADALYKLIGQIEQQLKISASKSTGAIITPTTQTTSTAILNIEAGIFTKPSDAEIKARLTPLQYQVTQQAGTEVAFNNLYWDNEQPGLYVDIVSGEPLFSSTDKFDSGTGWPSFTKPIAAGGVVEKQDNSFGMQRTEIISAIAHSHLGHLFNDGPLPLGTRYCMNSASLRFIAKADLQAQGYGKYSYLFQ